MGSGILCIIIGVVIIILYGDYKKIPNAKKTIGKIYSIESDKELYDEKSLSYRNVKYFVDGKEYYIKIKYKKKYSYSKKITVKYNKDNPSQAIIIHNFSDYLLPLFWIIFGICIIIYTKPSDPSEPIIRNEGDCCTCLDCPYCDVCCDCDDPYLTKDR